MVAVLAMLFIGAIAGQLMSAVLEPPFRPLIHGMNKLLPTEILPPPESITLFRRKQLDEKDFKDNLKAVGFDDKLANLLFTATMTFPNVQDGITFAVREAFREDIVQLFELDKNFDLLPLEFFEKIGISKENLLFFWRSHWILPSVGQGFEMFQRLNDLQLDFKSQDLARLGFDAEEVRTNLPTLETLLTTQDTMGFWQKRLLMIAYQPIPRIDVRRFYRLGLLTDEEAEFRVREFGRSPEDSKLEVIFTKADALMSDIRPLLRRGEMSFEEGEKMLIEVGVRKDRAQAMIQRIIPIDKKDRNARERDLTASNIMDAYEEGIFDRTEAAVALQGLGWDETESELKLQLRDIDIDKKDKKALEKKAKFTKADTLNAFVDNVIERTEAASRLDLLGFDNKDIEILLARADLKLAKIQTREADKSARILERQEKEIAKSDILKVFKLDQITRVEAKTRLLDKKFSNASAELLLEAVEIQLTAKESS